MGKSPKTKRDSVYYDSTYSANMIISYDNMHSFMCQNLNFIKYKLTSPLVKDIFSFLSIVILPAAISLLI